ncbi:unnamed protein product [Pleuronectes platessa]|uniref:WH1 domain-containing protein n=1 Tax=Pleuronectes platessa TaxID=8262 RepID=A0A9N7VS61_PLEPL|nr:unnamed protein product [Pleuronectes platessa]
MGEQPIFTTRAHVFQIDPTTKKNWVPASKQAVTVSYFYDSTRNSYRIISVDGSKATTFRMVLNGSDYLQSHFTLSSLSALTVKELKSCKAQCDALQAGHHLEMSQVEKTCRKKLGVLHEENAAQNEMVNGLSTLKAKSEDEVQQKDKPIQMEKEKTQARLNAYFHCLSALSGIWAQRVD